MGEYDEEWVSESSNGTFEEGLSQKKLLVDAEMSGEVAEEREVDAVEEEREGDEVEEVEADHGCGKKKKKKRKRHAADVDAADAILSLSKRSDDHQNNVAEKKTKKKKKGHRDRYDVATEKKKDASGSSSSKKLVRPFERIWKVEDEHLLFKLMAEYKHNTGKEPAVKNPAFMQFLRENNGLFVNEMTQEQVFNKIRYSKRKLRQHYKKKKNNNFETEEEESLFQLLSAIWPNCEEEEKEKKKKSLPISAAGNGSMNNNNGVIDSLTTLEQWFNEGIRTVECPEKRLKLESDWSRNKQRFAKARLRLLQLLTNVFTPSDN